MDKLLELFIKNHNNISDPSVRASYGLFSGFFGIVCNTFLAAVKIVLGLLSGSISIAADATNNLSDSLSSVITIVGFKLSVKPADREHPYGHGRIEYIAGFLVSISVIVVAIELLKESVTAIIKGKEIEISVLTIAILVISIIIKCMMGLFYRYMSKKINSAALKAVAADSFNDCLTTGVSLVSSVLIYAFNINIDGYAGAVVSIVVMISGLQSAKEIIDSLLGEKPPEDMEEKIKKTASENKNVLGVHDLKIHAYGPNMRVASLHVEIPYNLDLISAHDIIDGIEKEIVTKGYVNDITIHIDPVITDDEELLELKSFTEGVIKEIDQGISLHDFRLLHSASKSRVSFDIVVPYEFDMPEEELKKKISKKLCEYKSGCICSITVDKE